MKLLAEISRIDCRLVDTNGNLKHYFTIDRISINTALISGITFKLTRSILFEIMTYTEDSGFNFIKYERPNRTVTYDLLNCKFIEIKRIVKD